MTPLARCCIASLCAFLRLLPEPIINAIATVIAWFLQYGLRFRRSIIVEQLQVVYGHRRSAQEIHRILRGVYRHLGRLIPELLRLPGCVSTAACERVVWHGESHLIDAAKRGKGICLLTLHMGNWELPGIALVDKGYDFQVVAKEMKSGLGNVFLRMLRDDNGVTTINRHNAVKPVLRALKNNAVVAFVLDQNMTTDDGDFVEFFGHAACTLTGLAVVAARSGAAVLPGYTYRDEHNVHHCVVLPEIGLTHSGNSRQSAIENTQRFTHVIETIIDEHPEQWLWIHKRWRTRPSDEATAPFKYARR